MMLQWVCVITESDLMKMHLTEYLIDSGAQILRVRELAEELD
jgi:hypothetical protein